MFFKTFGDRTNLEEKMLGCIGQKAWNISYMHPNQKINLMIGI